MQPVEKHLLVTVSNDPAALHGLRFIHGFFSRLDHIRLTLLFISPRPSDPYDHLDESYFSPLSPFASQPHEAHMPAALETARQWLINMGFPQDRVEVKSLQTQLGKVKDIMVEAEKGLYDAVVLGRRGLTWMEEFFHDSVTHRLLWESITFPLWICRNPAQRRKNILLCVDGSEQAQRMADHVGFILAGEPEHQVTLFHNSAQPLIRGKSIQQVMEAAGLALTENGLEPERITYLVKTSKDHVGVILREAQDGEYAAVAVGRSYGRPSKLKNLLGTTSLTLLRNLEGSALWISK